jgi:hypothetical protein
VIPSVYLWENILPGFPDPIIDLAVARFKAVTLANGIGIVARWPKAGDSHMTDVMDNDPLEPIPVDPRKTGDCPSSSRTTSVSCSTITLTVSLLMAAATAMTVNASSSLISLAGVGRF